jgi:hypothetical protein
MSIVYPPIPRNEFVGIVKDALSDSRLDDQRKSAILRTAKDTSNTEFAVGTIVYEKPHGNFCGCPAEKAGLVDYHEDHDSALDYFMGAFDRAMNVRVGVVDNELHACYLVQIED